MKPADKVFLDGLRKSACDHISQEHWDLVVKAVNAAGDIRDVTGYARTVILEGVEKGRFASRSEAGRYAANMRWRGSVPQGGLATAEYRQEQNAKAGLGAGNPARGGGKGFDSPKMKEQLAYEAKRDGALGDTAANIADSVSEQDELRSWIDEQEGLLEVMQDNRESQQAQMQQRTIIEQAKRNLSEGKTAVPKPGTPGPTFDTQPGMKGEKYVGRRPNKVVAQDIRRDIKDAVASGELPAGLKFGVKMGSGGGSINVTVKGLKIERDDSGRMTGEAKAVYDKVDKITNAYNRNNSDSQTDYFDVDYYGFVRIDDFAS